MFAIFLVSCQDDTIVNQDNEDKQEEEAGNVMIKGTKTLSANQLWTLRDLEATNNLKLEDGYLKPKSSEGQATYQSVAIESELFLELVLSWNVRNLNDSMLIFSLSIGNTEGFGDFHLMGSFLDEKSRSLSSEENEYSKVSIDTLINKNSEENNLIKLKIAFSPSNNDDLALENISVTSKLVNGELNFDESLLSNKLIDVPAIQQLSVPLIGNIICSPTSLSMIANFYGYQFSQEEMSKKVYDNGARIYGNWTLNVSYVGSLDGLYGRVEYLSDFNEVINYINKDIPLVLSITTTSKEQLEGTIMAYAGGHLLVLVGFEEIDGTWYGIVNDPAEYENEKVQRKYKLDQIINVWRGYTYVISDENIF